MFQAADLIGQSVLLSVRHGRQLTEVTLTSASALETQTQRPKPTTFAATLSTTMVALIQSFAGASRMGAARMVSAAD